MNDEELDEYDYYESSEEIMPIESYKELLRDLKCSEDYIEGMIKSIFNGKAYDADLLVSVDCYCVELLD